MNNYQQRKFEKRKRDENPYESRRNILNDVYLHDVYTSLTNTLLEAIKWGNDDVCTVVELGSAGGISKTLYPTLITSDIRECDGVDRSIDAMNLPFDDNSVDGIIAKDVLHHLPNPIEHLSEVIRVLRPGAMIAYSEPNWNLLSRLVYRFIHPEPFEPQQETWSRESSEPMDANQALAMILFERDIQMLKKRFPGIEVSLESSTYALTFLISGGVYQRTAISGRLLQRLANRETKSPTWMKIFGLNRVIVIKKVDLGVKP